jgi:hypothetical protein
VAVARYVLLINWTEQWIAAFEDTTDRADAAADLASSLGASCSRSTGAWGIRHRGDPQGARRRNGDRVSAQALLPRPVPVAGQARCGMRPSTTVRVKRSKATGIMSALKAPG